MGIEISDIFPLNYVPFGLSAPIGVYWPPIAWLPLIRCSWLGGFGALPRNPIIVLIQDAHHHGIVRRSKRRVGGKSSV